MQGIMRPVVSWGMLLAMALVAGCGQTTPPAAPQAETAEAEHAHGHSSHDGWWCNEHGVPEELCALCDTKLAAEFQKKGDWCADHERPDSQCFDCHPELEVQFAARYEAKYGHQPPKPEG